MQHCITKHIMLLQYIQKALNIANCVRNLKLFMAL